MMSRLIINTGGAFSVPPPGVTAVLGLIPILPRDVLSAIVTAMINRIDELDGDPDFEPEQDRCLAGDDGCGAVVIPWFGRVVYGSDHEECGE